MGSSASGRLSIWAGSRDAGRGRPPRQAERNRSDRKVVSASLLGLLGRRDSGADPLLTRACRALPCPLLHAASGEMDIQAGRFLAARLLGSLFQNSPWSTDCSLSSSSLVPGGIPVSLPKSFPFSAYPGEGTCIRALSRGRGAPTEQRRALSSRRPQFSESDAKTTAN